MNYLSAFFLSAALAGGGYAALDGAKAGERLVLDRVPFSRAASVLLRHVSSRPFVLCDAVIGDNRLVSLRWEPANLTAESVTSLFAAYGYSLSGRKGILFACTERDRQPAGSAVATNRPASPERSGPAGGSTKPFSDLKPGESPQEAERLPSAISPSEGPKAPQRPPEGKSALDEELWGYPVKFVTAKEISEGGKPLFPHLKIAPVENGGRQMVFATGPREDVDRFRDFAVYQDRPAQIVEVQAIVLELTEGKQQGFGLSAVLKSLAGFGLDVEGTARSQQLSFSKGSFQAVLSAVSGSTGVRVISSPRVSGISGQSLRLQVGEDVPTLGAVVQSVVSGNTQSIQYRASGIIFEVTPLVLGHAVNVKIHQEVSSFAQTATGVSGSPTLSTRVVDSSVQLANGGWTVLGGLSSKSSNTTADSLLGLVPLGRSKTESRTEIVTLLHVSAAPASEPGAAPQEVARD